MKKFLLISVSFILLMFFSGEYSFVYGLDADTLKDNVIPYNSTVTTPSGTVLEGEGFLDYVLGFGRDIIFALMALLAIGMFLYIGGRLAVARGNPEEFKKAMMSFVYAGIGIFTVAFAWAIVRLVAGIDL